MNGNRENLAISLTSRNEESAERFPLSKIMSTICSTWILLVSWGVQQKGHLPPPPPSCLWKKTVYVAFWCWHSPSGEEALCLAGFRSWGDTGLGLAGVRDVWGLLEPEGDCSFLEKLFPCKKWITSANRAAWQHPSTPGGFGVQQESLQVLSQKGDAQLELLLLSSLEAGGSFGCWDHEMWGPEGTEEGDGCEKEEGATSFWRCVVRGLEKKCICLSFRVECNLGVGCAFGRELNQMTWKCLLQPELFSDWFYSFVMAFSGEYHKLLSSCSTGIFNMLFFLLKNLILLPRSLSSFFIFAFSCCNINMLLVCIGEGEVRERVAG